MTTVEYNHIIQELADHLYRYALKLSYDTESAKDLVQDSYMKLWINKSKITTDHAKPFLFRVLFNKMVDNKRKMKRISNPEIMPETEIRSNSNLDEKDMIEYAFKQLDEKQRKIIMLRDWDGYAYDEIAEILGISLSLVKVNLFRARKKMKAIVSSEDEDFKKKIINQ